MATNNPTNSNRSVGRIQVKKTMKPHDYVKSYFKYIVYAITFIFLLAGYLYLIKPKYDQVMADRIQNEAAIENISSLNSDVTRLEAIKKKYDSVDRAAINKINAVLPDKPFNDRLIAELANMTAANGLLLNALSINLDDASAPDPATLAPDGSAIADPQEAALASRTGKVKISLELSGTDYENLKKIISVIEKNMRLLDITNVDFNPDSKSAKLELEAYYQK